jgi:hypothetical protein
MVADHHKSHRTGPGVGEPVRDADVLGAGAAVTVEDVVFAADRVVDWPVWAGRFTGASGGGVGGAGRWGRMTGSVHSEDCPQPTEENNPDTLSSRRQIGAHFSEREFFLTAHSVVWILEPSRQ